MGFAGGGGSIAIATAPPLSFLVLYCKHSHSLWFSVCLIFYACIRLRFSDVKTNPGPQRPILAVCRILCCTNVQGLSGNHSALTVASSQYAAGAASAAPFVL